MGLFEEKVAVAWSDGPWLSDGIVPNLQALLFIFFSHCCENDICHDFLPYLWSVRPIVLLYWWCVESLAEQG